MVRGLKFQIYKVDGFYYLCSENKGADQLSGYRHTCDTFLNPNREIWNFWSGNLCLVSGDLHVANFGLFLPKLKSRNLVLPSITLLTYANRSEKMRPFTV